MVAPDAVSENDIDKLIIPDDLPGEPAFKAYIEAKVYDKEGHIIDYRRQPMRSLTQWFLAIMSIPLIGTYQSSSTNQAPGILVNILGLPSQQSVYGGKSASVAWDWGIQVGSGTQSFSPTLTGLAAPIVTGTGTGELYYGAVSVIYATATIITMVTVTNYSASAISVTEIGLTGTVYLQYYNTSNVYAYNTYKFLLSYDTFSTAISIPAGGMATFQITLTFTG
jgi:hypothetical protein